MTVKVAVIHEAKVRLRRVAELAPDSAIAQNPLASDSQWLGDTPQPSPWASTFDVNSSAEGGVTNLLVTGASGTVSSALLRVLNNHDVKLRALVRDPERGATIPHGIELVVGDLDEPRSLKPAFEGVDVVWLLTAMGPQAPHQSMNAVWAARQAGVRHISRMSAVGAAHDAPTRNGRLHALSDGELMASGIPWTIIRPAFFMQNLRGALVNGTFYGSTGEGRVGMVDVSDIADFAALVLLTPTEHEGKVYTLTGPASLSLRDAAADLSSVLDAKIAYQPLSPDEAEAAMLQAGMNPWTAAVNAEYAAAYADGWGDFTTQDFPNVVGRPARNFADFAHDHIHQFGAHID